MVDKVNGKAMAGEFLGKNLDFFIVTTPTNLTVDQAKLDAVVETISLNGQPVILAAPTFASNSCTLKFAIEHTGAWTAAGLTAALSAPGVGLTTPVVTINGGLS